MQNLCGQDEDPTWENDRGTYKIIVDKNKNSCGQIQTCGLILTSLGETFK